MRIKFRREELPRRKHATFRTRRKFEIKKIWLDGLDSSGSEHEIVTVACERGSKTSGSIKDVGICFPAAINIWSGTIFFKF